MLDSDDDNLGKQYPPEYYENFEDETGLPDDL